MAYSCDRAALVSASTVAALTSLTSAQQDALYDAAVAAIEEYTGQRFEEYTETKLVDGSGLRVLHLPAKLASITEVKIKDVVVPASDLGVSNDGRRLFFTGSAGNYYTRALADEEIKVFTREPEAVSIEGTWGWSTTPAAICQALRYDMEDTAMADASVLSSTVHTYRKLGIFNISQGNLSASLRNAPRLSDRVTSLLDPFIWQGVIGQVA